MQPAWVVGFGVVAGVLSSLAVWMDSPVPAPVGTVGDGVVPAGLLPNPKELLPAVAGVADLGTWGEGGFTTPAAADASTGAGAAGAVLAGSFAASELVAVAVAAGPVTGVAERFTSEGEGDGAVVAIDREDPARASCPARAVTGAEAPIGNRTQFLQNEASPLA